MEINVYNESISGYVMSTNVHNVSVFGQVESVEHNGTNTLDGMTTVSSLVAVYMLCMSLLGTVANGIVLFVIRRHPGVLNSNIGLVQYLCACGLLMSLLAVPFIFMAMIYNTRTYGYIACQVYGFLISTVSFTSMALLSAIAIQRFTVILTMDTSDTRRNAACMSANRLWGALCFSFGLLQGFLPLVGFGSYGQEHDFLSCAPTWWSKESLDFEYTLLILVCSFFIPICLIAMSYLGILIKVRKASGTRLINSSHSKFQHRLTVIAFMLTLFFFLAWGPYAIVAILQAFKDQPTFSPLASILPIALAKSSVVWNPVIYTIGCRKFRRALLNDIDVMKGHISFRKSSQAANDRQIARATEGEQLNTLLQQRVSMSSTFRTEIVSP